MRSHCSLSRTVQPGWRPKTTHAQGSRASYTWQGVTQEQAHPGPKRQQCAAAKTTAAACAVMLRLASAPIKNQVFLTGCSFDEHLCLNTTPPSVIVHAGRHLQKPHGDAQPGHGSDGSSQRRAHGHVTRAACCTLQSPGCAWPKRRMRHRLPYPLRLPYSGSSKRQTGAPPAEQRPSTVPLRCCASANLRPPRRPGLGPLPSCGPWPQQLIRGPATQAQAKLQRPAACYHLCAQHRQPAARAPRPSTRRWRSWSGHLELTQLSLAVGWLHRRHTTAAAPARWAS